MITVGSYSTVDKAIKLLGDMSGVKMCELGNQIVKYPGIKRQSSKRWFEGMGVNHTSIDINGKDGALNLDLAKPIDMWPDGEFDIVTNIGTTEHVENGQYEAFENIHRFVKPGGLMVHTLPKKGYYGRHGIYRYEEDFFEGLAKANDYEVEYLESVMGVNPDNCLVCCILTQGTASFMSEGDFDRIQGLSLK
jgi:SAM-dependent methyltransferase